ncbi:hypothetical protein OAS66_09385, partial [Alphaproteobacteria bacterium]|nr:hypothetical protein [Alphaproteobacteria bacterium]
MNDKKTILDLLEIIGEVFATDIVPNLPKTQQSTAKMIQQGLDIATRNLKKGPKGAENLPTKIIEAKQNTLRNKNIAELKKTQEPEHFAKDIRNQKYDSNLLGPIIDILEDQIKQRLELSNPDYLTSEEFSQPNAN